MTYNYNNRLDELFKDWKVTSAKNGHYTFCCDGLIYKGKVYDKQWNIKSEGRDHFKNRVSFRKTIGVGVILLLAMFFYLPFELLAQKVEKTAYEKRVEQIYKEVAQQLGYSEVNNVVAAEILSGATDFLAGKNTKRARAYSWLSDEMEAAKKLKTQADFDKEKAEKLRQLAQEEETDFKNSDFYRIREKIKTAFEKWNQKGEFETTAVYTERLKEKSVQEFFKVCINVIKDYSSGIYGYGGKDLAGVLQPYNADAQYFPVKFSFGSKGQVGYIVTVPVPIDDAIAFKDNYKSSEYHSAWTINSYDYVFVNNLLVPSKVSYKGIEYIVPVKNAKEVQFSFNDLGIQNPYCKDVVYHIYMIKLAEEERLQQEAEQKRLEEEQAAEQKRLVAEQKRLEEERAAAKAKEQQRLDSIVCVEYNQNLDSIIQAYNQKLLQNEYNLEKQQVKNKSIVCGGDMERKYKDAATNIETTYNAITKQADSYRQQIDNFKNQNNLEDFEFVPCSNYRYTGAGGMPHSPLNTIVDNKIRNIKFDVLRDKLIEVAVDSNRQLNKEWTKNGRYFDNKTDFLESYIGSCDGFRYLSLNENYKNILKQKKGEKK